jgi:hypothetical protein
MEQMMGGEGSPTLRQMHINLGKTYLGSGGNYGTGMMGGFGMMGNWNSAGARGGTFPMMGYNTVTGWGNGFGIIHGLFAVFTWIAIMLFLLSGTYFFIRQAGKSNKR